MEQVERFAILNTLVREYYAGRDESEFTFTEDPAKAISFSERDDAVAWTRRNLQNPDGGIIEIKPVTVMILTLKEMARRIGL